MGRAKSFFSTIFLKTNFINYLIKIIKVKFVKICNIVIYKNL